MVKANKAVKKRQPRKSKITRKARAASAPENVSIETIMHVAKLARLNLTQAEARKYQKDINEILSSFKELKKIKPGVKPSFQPLDVKDVLRSDTPEKCFTSEAALSHTPHKERGFFKGPRAV
jgi:aspartyl-tRNA(Asn)/glutamyl-tRNA(Gln) amidotransferase subunit C